MKKSILIFICTLLLFQKHHKSVVFIQDSSIPESVLFSGIQNFFAVNIIHEGKELTIQSTSSTVKCDIVETGETPVKCTKISLNFVKLKDANTFYFGYASGDLTEYNHGSGSETTIMLDATWTEKIKKINYLNGNNRKLIVLREGRDFLKLVDTTSANRKNFYLQNNGVRFTTILDFGDSKVNKISVGFEEGGSNFLCTYDLTDLESGDDGRDFSPVLPCKEVENLKKIITLDNSMSLIAHGTSISFWNFQTGILSQIPITDSMGDILDYKILRTFNIQLLQQDGTGANSYRFIRLLDPVYDFSETLPSYSDLKFTYDGRVQNTPYLMIYGLDGNNLKKVVYKNEISCPNCRLCKVDNNNCYDCGYGGLILITPSTGKRNCHGGCAGQTSLNVDAICLLEGCPLGFGLDEPSSCKPCTVQKCEDCRTNYQLCDACEGGATFSTGVCGSCPSNCQSCSSSTSCDNCNDGFFKNGGSCTACPENCATCDGLTSCLTCNENFLKEETSCVASCSADHFKDGTSCVQTCSGSGKKQEGECVSSCTGDFFEDGDSCVQTCTGTKKKTGGKVCYTVQWRLF